MIPSRFSRPWRALAVYGGVVLLVAAAVTLTAVRLALPRAEVYRAEVERQMSAYLGQPVRIARMEARLPRFSPTLVLGDVQLLDLSNQTIAKFREIRVGLAIGDTLWRRELVLDQVTVVGASLVIERRAGGSFHVQGLTLSQDEPSDPEAVGRWLLAQHRIALRDSHLVWRDQLSGKSFTFDGASLALSNGGESHRLNARVRLPDDLGGELHLAVDMTGDPLARGGLSGRFHLAGEKMRPAGLMRLFPLPGISPGAGDLSLEMWGEWKAARLIAAQGRLKGNGLLFTSARNRVEKIDQVGARFAWQREANGWRLDLADLVVTRDGRGWNPARMSVDLSMNAAGERAYRLQADFLRLEDLCAIAGLVPAEGDWQRRLAALELRGDLSQVHVEYGPDGRIRAGAAFNDAGAAANEGHPGASGLDGYAYYADGIANVRFATRNARLDFNGLFRFPLTVDQLTGEVHARRDGSAWLIDSDGLSLANSDIRLRAALQLRLPHRGAPFLDLRGDFFDGNAAAVPRYLPAGIMPANAVAWLDRAFVAGRVVEGGVIVHGRLDQFPFDHNEGRFEVRFTAQEVDLDYLHGWPRLTGIAGEVVFDGRGMQVEATRAGLGGDQVSRAKVAITDLLQPRLQVQGHVEGQLNHLFDYLRASGLAGHLTPVLARFDAGGGYALDLTLEHPLATTLVPGNVHGEVTFDESRLAVAGGVEFTGIRGKLRFHDMDYQSEKISARLFGAPARLRVATAKSGAATVTRLSLDGTVAGGELKRAFDHPLIAHLKGSAPLEAELTLAHEPGSESALRLVSPLTGLAVELPAPLAKSAKEKEELVATLRLAGPRTGQLEISLGERIAATLALASEGKQLLKGAVHFGGAVAELPGEAALVVTGRLPELSAAEWVRLLGVQNENGDPALQLPIRIQMDELGILSAAAAQEGHDEDRPAAQLPPLDVRIGELRYNQLRLGALSFRTVNPPQGVVMEDLKLKAPQFTLTGNGVWHQDDTPRTELTLHAAGKDLGKAAEALGVASVISEGKFDADAQLTWNGAPHEVNLGNLEGTLKVKVKGGSVTQVKPGAGRLLGLLSLQALPQRLTLDFRDLFDEGMHFRTLEGTFHLKDGNAFSDNLHMNSLPAAVFVTGRTGLLTRDFDQTVTVVPDVSGTLPIAGGLALGPQVGAALLLVQQLFRNKIDEVSQYNYTVTGSWDSPVIRDERKKH